MQTLHIYGNIILSTSIYRKLLYTPSLCQYCGGLYTWTCTRCQATQRPQHSHIEGKYQLVGVGYTQTSWTFLRPVRRANKYWWSTWHLVLEVETTWTDFSIALDLCVFFPQWYSLRVYWNYFRPHQKLFNSLLVNINPTIQ